MRQGSQRLNARYTLILLCLGVNQISSAGCRTTLARECELYISSLRRCRICKSSEITALKKQTECRMRSILVTGGSGFIGSHTVVELLELGYRVVVYDNLTNSSMIVVERIFSIVGTVLKKAVPLEFVEGDIRDKSKLAELFANHSFDCVIHFAGLKSLGESYTSPLEYYNNNVFGTLCLC